MKLSALEYNILSYLLSTNVISHNGAVEWAFNQYSNNGVDPFVEKITLTIDSSEIRHLISDTFQAYGEPSKDFLFGETVEQFIRKQLSLNEAINRVLFDIEPNMTKEDEQKMYIAEDYFSWQKNAESEALKLVRDVFHKYHAIYKSAVSTFGV